MAFSLEGRVALVTGSSRGLGRGIALALGKAGAKVVVNYFNDRASAEDAMGEMKAAGVHAMLVRADASDPEQAEDMVQSASEKLGTVDVVVPNATPDQPQKPIEEYDADFYRQMYDFFVMGPYHLARAALPATLPNDFLRLAIHAGRPRRSPTEIDFVTVNQGGR